MIGLFASLVLVIMMVAVNVTAQETTPDGKKIAKSVDDLPRDTYPVTSPPSSIITNLDEFNWLANQLKTDIHEVLDTYEIEDKNTLQTYYTTLLTIAFLEGDYDGYLKYLEIARGLEQKEAQKLTMGMTGTSYIDALEVSRDTKSAEFRAAFRQSLTAKVAAMPWDVVHNQLQQLNGQLQILSEDLLVGVIQSQVDPAVEASGFLSSDQAGQLVSFRSALVLVIDFKDDIASVIGEAVASHEVETTNIWPDRTVTFNGDEGYSPVVVGVWDSGVDVDVFDGRLFVNANETVDGKDNDGNGFVDDVHGVAYDLDHNKTVDLLYPLGDKESQRTDLENQLKGFMDNGASLNTPESTELRKQMAGLEADDVKPFLEDLNLYAFHSHGTHVAGIAVNGNPYARILTARLTFDHRMVPQPITMESAKAFAVEVNETVQYFKDNGVGVVNMSWGLSLKEVEQTLAANGIGETAEERGAMAKEIFDVSKAGLYEAIKGAPDIVFVAAAGNSDNDVEFDEFAPPSFELPNLLIVAAVDQGGQATSFTSEGGTVAVYANGFEVESYVPGGREMALSGTSMASPNVTNLAGKLLAVDPSLSPPEIIKLIISGSEALNGDEMLIINSRRSLDLLTKNM